MGWVHERLNQYNLKHGECGCVIFSDNLHNLYFKVVLKVYPMLLKPMGYIHIRDEQSTV